MTLKPYLMEGTAGTAATSASTSANLFSLVNGGTANYVTGRTGTAVRFANVGANNALGRWLANAAGTTMSFAVDFRIDTLPTSGRVTVASTRTASAGPTMLWQVEGNGQLVAFVSGSSSYLPAPVATGLAANTWYRLEAQLVGGSTTAGTLQARVCPAATSTPVSAAVSASNLNLRTDAMVGGDFGYVTGGGSTANHLLDIDNVRFNDGVAEWIGPYMVANTAPQVTITGNQNKAAGAPVTAAVTATDDGSIASYAWTVASALSSIVPALTGASTATVTFTAPAAGHLVRLQCVVTDDAGAATTVTTEVRTPLPASSPRRPLAMPGTGDAWANVGGAANAGAALANSSDTDYLETPDLAAVETAYRVRWQPSEPLDTAQMVNRLWVSAGTGQAVVRLIEGTVVRQFWTHAVTAVPTDYTDELSASAIAAINDATRLYVEVGFTA